MLGRFSTVEFERGWMELHHRHHVQCPVPPIALFVQYLVNLMDHNNQASLPTKCYS